MNAELCWFGLALGGVYLWLSSDPCVLPGGSAAKVTLVLLGNKHHQCSQSCVLGWDWPGERREANSASSCGFWGFLVSADVA